MGLTHVTALQAFDAKNGAYEANFLVDTGATHSFAPASELTRIGVQPVGKMSYELANGKVEEYQFGLVRVAFMGVITAGRVIFGPDAAAAIVGVTVFGSVGIGHG